MSFREDVRSTLERDRVSADVATSETQQEAPPTGRQADGSYVLDTDITDDQAKKMAASVTREQFENYMETFVPTEKKLIGSQGETFDSDGRNDAWVAADKSRASLERMRSRYGTQLSTQQQAAEWRSSGRDKQLSGLGAMNTRRQASEDRDYNLQGSLLNVGRNLSSSGMSGLSEGAINAQKRQDAHKQAKAQHSANESAQQAQTVASLAGLAALAFT